MEINVNNFEEEVLKSDKPVLLRFYFENGCPPCNNYKPIFEKFTADHPEIKCVSVSRSSNREPRCALAEQFDIKSYPTTLAFFKGELVNRETGAIKPERLVQMTKTTENASTEELEAKYYDLNIEIAQAEKQLHILKATQLAIFTEVGRRKMGITCLQECVNECPQDDQACLDKCADICKHGRSCMSQEDREALKAHLNK